LTGSGSAKRSRRKSPRILESLLNKRTDFSRVICASVEEPDL
jgi:hypothetical protein